MYIVNPEALSLVISTNPLWENKSEQQLADHIFDKVTSVFGLTSLSLGLCIFYGILFCFGLVGNLWVISVVVYIFKTLRNTVPNYNVFVYIFCLSAVDSCVLLIVPMLISDILFYRWVFGPFLCKMYYVIESSNKLLSTFMLAALSCDRFLAVCYPNIAYKVRTVKTTVILVIGLFVFVTILLAPLHYSSGETSYEEYIYEGNVTITVGLPKCSLAMTPELMITFTTYLFVIGFCIPGLLITYFYVRVLCRVYSHAKSFGDHHTHIPIRRVTVATLMVILFYFVCWTPYWGLTMHLVAVPQDTDATPPPSAQEPAEELHHVLISYFFHSLVYVNSAFNWVFYALLNKHLRESHDAAVERNRSYSLSKLTRTPAVCDSPADKPSCGLKPMLRIRVDSKSSGVSFQTNGDISGHSPAKEEFL